ncbi:hypothetical protein BDZ97DRAFT_2071491 [Flammula alnicola]|nr:hypothetical protein BDZ97DRAFT_2071491 [Flammula alnicola]
MHPNPQTSNRIVALINKVLPGEILAEILTHTVVCSHSDSNVEQCFAGPVGHPFLSKITSIHHHQCISTPDPLLLSQVCSQWRDIILHMPMLWVSIAIISYPGERLLQLLKLWLARSGQLPISIFFLHHRFGEVRSGFHKSFVSLFQLLAYHAARWRAIDLDIYDLHSPNTPACLEQFISPNSLTSLESVTLNIVGPSMLFVNDITGHFFRSNSLHTLKWASGDVYIRNLRVLPPWSQMRFLELLKIWDTKIILTAISASEKLESLHIGECTISEVDNITVTLPNLQILRLTGINNLSCLLDKLTFPGLRALFLKDTINIRAPHSTWDTIESLLLRSGCPLARFSLIDKAIRHNEERLIQHLSSPVFYSLTELTLASLTLVDRLISGLVY